jgi:(2R)-sulfolactate sulfo-lyase subunit alpha
VVVVEGLKKGADMLCVVTASNSSFKLKSRMDVPIGHKVALTDIKKGDTIWKYGQDIGVAKAMIGKGEHVHVHNIKTKRW